MGTDGPSLGRGWSKPVMNLATITVLRHRLRGWWNRHRPLGWFETAFGSFETWRPDPPVMERLIR